MTSQAQRLAVWLMRAPDDMARVELRYEGLNGSQVIACWQRAELR